MASLSESSTNFEMVNLSLARASDRTITTSGLGTSVGVAIGMSVRSGVAVAGGFCDGRDFHIPHLDQSLFAGVAARTSSLGGLLVGGKVEGDEEEEVRAQDAHTGKSGKLFTSAATGIGSPWEVSVREIGVGSEVNESWSIHG